MTVAALIFLALSGGPDAGAGGTPPPAEASSHVETPPVPAEAPVSAATKAAICGVHCAWLFSRACASNGSRAS